MGKSTRNHYFQVRKLLTISRGYPIFPSCKPPFWRWDFHLRHGSGAGQRHVAPGVVAGREVPHAKGILRHRGRALVHVRVFTQRTYTIIHIHIYTYTVNNHITNQYYNHIIQI